MRFRVFLLKYNQWLRIISRVLFRLREVDVHTLVTAGPPTSNGDLHLGHLSGPYTAADIHTRFLRLHRRDVRAICAADDHQSYVALKAAQTGRSPAEVADDYGGVIARSLGAADVALDLFGHPARSGRYRAFIQQFVTTLHGNGALHNRTSDVPYCASCDRLLFEAHIKGRCKHCNAGSDGGICEACGFPNGGADLKDARCAACSTPTSETRPATRLVFPLNDRKDYLRRYVATAQMNAHARALCDALLDSDLPDVAVTQPADWGIEVPLPGFDDQRISAWFELGPHYLAITDMLHEAGGGPDWRSVWTGSTDVVQCFGFDSAYFHIVLFPALFHAFDPAIRPPCGFIVNEFYRLDGAKFSTSRKHALWASDFFQNEPCDAARFHLCATRPEVEQTNFTLAEYRDTLSGELIGVWDAWLRGLAARSPTTAPAATDWTPAHLRFHARLAAITAAIDHCYEVAEFSTHRATRLLGDLVRDTSAFATANAFHAGNAARQGEYRTGLALELAAARALALAASPMMPRFGAALWSDLGLGDIADARWNAMPQLLIDGTPLALRASGYCTHLPDQKVLAA